MFRGWEWEDVGNGFESVIKPFDNMMSGDHRDETFFVVGGRDGWNVSSVSGMVLVTMVFGGIHCIAWSFAFPSTTEQLLWRISSIAITGIPLAVAGIVFIRRQLRHNNPVYAHPLHHPYSTRSPLSHFPNPVAGIVPYDSAVSSSLGVPDGAVDDFSSSRLAGSPVLDIPPTFSSRSSLPPGPQVPVRPFYIAIARLVAVSTVNPRFQLALDLSRSNALPTSHSPGSFALVNPDPMSSVVIDANT